MPRKSAIVALALVFSAGGPAAYAQGAWTAIGRVADILGIASVGKEGGTAAADYFKKLNANMKGIKVANATFTSLQETISPNARLVLDEINNSGEKGMLLDVMIFERKAANGTTEFVLSEVMPNGFGSDPTDAAFKSMISEDKIFSDGMLNAMAARQKLPDSSFSVSDLSYGIFLFKGEDGSLKVRSIPDLKSYTQNAAIKWKLHKGMLLDARTQPALEHLKVIDNAYDKIVDDYEIAAKERGLIGQLNILRGAQQDAAEKLRIAEKTLEDAYSRQKKYKGYQTAASVLGLGKAAVEGWEGLADKQEAKKSYYEGAVIRNSALVSEKRLSINYYLIQNFNLTKDSLPPPDVKTNIRPR